MCASAADCGVLWQACGSGKPGKGRPIGGAHPGAGGVHRHPAPTRRHRSSELHVSPSLTAGSVVGMSSMEQAKEATRWTILGERVVDDSRRGRLSVVSIELLDGVQFEQYVLRIRKGA